MPTASPAPFSCFCSFNLEKTTLLVFCPIIIKHYHNSICVSSLGFLTLETISAIHFHHLSSLVTCVTRLHVIGVGPLSRPDPFWRIRTESEMPCYHSIIQNPIFAEAISKFVQAHKHLHLTKYIYHEDIQAFSK